MINAIYEKHQKNQDIIYSKENIANCNISNEDSSILDNDKNEFINKDKNLKFSQQSDNITKEENRSKRQKYINTDKSAKRAALSLSPKKNTEGFLLPKQAGGYSEIKTLILDLDETLVHSSFDYVENPDIIIPIIIEEVTYEIYILVRPGTKEFINALAKYYEIVIFTASISEYADPLISILDPNYICKYRLFREHCTYIDGTYVKDLNKMGRHLRNLVIVDNSPMSYSFHKNNGIPIKSWYEDKSDRDLIKMIPYLQNLSFFYDVRSEIPRFVVNNTIIWKKAFEWLEEYNLLNPKMIEVIPIKLYSDQGSSKNNNNNNQENTNSISDKNKLSKEPPDSTIKNLNSIEAKNKILINPNNIISSINNRITNYSNLQEFSSENKINNIIEKNKEKVLNSFHIIPHKPKKNYSSLKSKIENNNNNSNGMVCSNNKKNTTIIQVSTNSQEESFINCKTINNNSSIKMESIMRNDSTCYLTRNFDNNNNNNNTSNVNNDYNLNNIPQKEKENQFQVNFNNNNLNNVNIDKAKTGKITSKNLNKYSEIDKHLKKILSQSKNILTKSNTSNNFNLSRVAITTDSNQKDKNNFYVYNNCSIEKHKNFNHNSNYFSNVNTTKTSVTKENQSFKYSKEFNYQQHVSHTEGNYSNNNFKDKINSFDLKDSKIMNKLDTKNFKPNCIVENKNQLKKSFIKDKTIATKINDDNLTHDYFFNETNTIVANSKNKYMSYCTDSNLVHLNKSNKIKIDGINFQKKIIHTDNSDNIAHKTGKNFSKLNIKKERNFTENQNDHDSNILYPSSVLQTDPIENDEELNDNNQNNLKTLTESNSNMLNKINTIKMSVPEKIKNSTENIRKDIDEQNGIEINHNISLQSFHYANDNNTDDKNLDDMNLIENELFNNISNNLPKENFNKNININIINGDYNKIFLNNNKLNQNNIQSENYNDLVDCELLINKNLENNYSNNLVVNKDHTINDIADKEFHIEKLNLHNTNLENDIDQNNFHPNKKNHISTHVNAESNHQKRFVSNISNLSDYSDVSAKFGNKISEIENELFSHFLGKNKENNTRLLSKLIQNDNINNKLYNLKKVENNYNLKCLKDENRNDINRVNLNENKNNNVIKSLNHHSELIYDLSDFDYMNSIDFNNFKNKNMMNLNLNQSNNNTSTSNSFSNSKVLLKSLGNSKLNSKSKYFVEKKIEDLKSLLQKDVIPNKIIDDNKNTNNVNSEPNINIPNNKSNFNNIITNKNNVNTNTHLKETSSLSPQHKSKDIQTAGDKGVIIQNMISANNDDSIKIDNFEIFRNINNSLYNQKLKNKIIIDKNRNLQNSLNYKKIHSDDDGQKKNKTIISSVSPEEKNNDINSNIMNNRIINKKGISFNHLQSKSPQNNNIKMKNFNVSHSNKFLVVKNNANISNPMINNNQADSSSLGKNNSKIMKNISNPNNISPDVLKESSISIKKISIENYSHKNTHLKSKNSINDNLLKKDYSKNLTTSNFSRISQSRNNAFQNETHLNKEQSEEFLSFAKANLPDNNCIKPNRNVNSIEQGVITTTTNNGNDDIKKKIDANIENIINNKNKMRNKPLTNKIILKNSKLKLATNNSKEKNSSIINKSNVGSVVNSNLSANDFRINNIDKTETLNRIKENKKKLIYKNLEPEPLSKQNIQQYSDYTNKYIPKIDLQKNENQFLSNNYSYNVLAVNVSPNQRNKKNMTNNLELTFKNQENSLIKNTNINHGEKNFSNSKNKQYTKDTYNTENEISDKQSFKMNSMNIINNDHNKTLNNLDDVQIKEYDHDEKEINQKAAIVNNFNIDYSKKFSNENFIYKDADQISGKKNIILENERKENYYVENQSPITKNNTKDIRMNFINGNKTSNKNNLKIITPKNETYNNENNLNLYNKNINNDYLIPNNNQTTFNMYSHYYNFVKKNDISNNLRDKSQLLINNSNNDVILNKKINLQLEKPNKSNEICNNNQNKFNVNLNIKANNKSEFLNSNPKQMLNTFLYNNHIQNNKNANGSINNHRDNNLVDNNTFKSSTNITNNQQEDFQNKKNNGGEKIGINKSEMETNNEIKNTNIKNKTTQNAFSLEKNILKNYTNVNMENDKSLIKNSNLANKPLSNQVYSNSKNLINNLNFNNPSSSNNNISNNSNIIQLLKNIQTSSNQSYSLNNKNVASTYNKDISSNIASDDNKFFLKNIKDEYVNHNKSSASNILKLNTVTGNVYNMKNDENLEKKQTKNYESNIEENQNPQLFVSDSFYNNKGSIKIRVDNFVQNTENGEILKIPNNINIENNQLNNKDDILYRFSKLDIANTYNNINSALIPIRKINSKPIKNLKNNDLHLQPENENLSNINTPHQAQENNIKNIYFQQNIFSLNQSHSTQNKSKNLIGSVNTFNIKK